MRRSGGGGGSVQRTEGKSGLVWMYAGRCLEEWKEKITIHRVFDGLGSTSTHAGSIHVYKTHLASEVSEAGRTDDRGTAWATLPLRPQCTAQEHVYYQTYYVVYV